MAASSCHEARPSLALAQILAEDRVPPESLWQEPLVSSRLIEYEIWARVHAQRLGASRGDEVRTLLARVSLIEMAPPVLARALEPFPDLGAHPALEAV